MKRLAVLVTVLVAASLATAAAASGGLGKFQTKLTGKGAKTENGRLDGTWTIDLTSSTSGKLNLTWNGKKTGGGTYSISGSIITLTPKKGGSCPGKAKYRFKATPNTLRFTKVSDTCAVRRDVLTFGTWTK